MGTIRAKYEISVYDCYFENYKFTIMPNDKVDIFCLYEEGVHIGVNNRDGYITYEQFRNGLKEEKNG